MPQVITQAIEHNLDVQEIPEGSNFSIMKILLVPNYYSNQVQVKLHYKHSN